MLVLVQMIETGMKKGLFIVDWFHLENSETGDKNREKVNRNLS